MSEKVPARPAWYKNTYFWIAVALFLLSVLAKVGGPNLIRDPGQKREDGLAMWYFIAAVVMYVNGWLSHQHTVRIYREMVGDQAPAAVPVEASATPADAAETTPPEENK